jgi:hypothetical protein
VKRVLLVGICIGVAYLVVLFLAGALVVPAGTDEFRTSDLQSSWFHVRMSLGRDHVIDQPLLAIFIPLAWLLKSSDGDVSPWFLLVAIPYVLLLGIIVSFLCHRISAVVRARQS